MPVQVTRLRVIAGATGVAMLLYALRRRDQWGPPLGALGAGLLVGGLALGVRLPAALQPAVGIPADRVFEYWNHYEDLHRPSAQRVPRRGAADDAMHAH